jgi:hypothetical protein
MSGEAPRQHSLRERVGELYRRLRLLPQATSGAQAFQQLCETLDQVEDEFSGVKKKSPPPPPQSPDGRMYCPAEDHTVRRPDGSILALARGHRIEISADGRLKIVNKVTLQIEFEK